MINVDYDVIIIGGGPAGLSSSIYLGRAGYRVLVIEKYLIGGQITITKEVVNYPGVFKTSGTELTNEMHRQAKNFGVEFLSAEVTSINVEKAIRTVTTRKGEHTCYGIVLALGAKPRTVGFEGEERFKGSGVAYCATCDGEFFTGLEILVIGGGYAAAEEGIFLTRYASKVTILVRKDAFKCAKRIVDEVLSNPKIEVRYNTELLSIEGNDYIEKAVLKNNKTGEEYEYKPQKGETFGVFVFVGYEPETSLVKDVITLNEQEYIVTDQNGMTNIEGVYAAGDVCIKKLRQIVTAVSDGAKVATELEKYIEHQQKENGFVPKMPARSAQNTHGLSGEKVDSAASHTVAGTESGQQFFTEQMRIQLAPVLERMSQDIRLEVVLGNEQASKDLKQLLNELMAVTNRIKVDYTTKHEQYLPAMYVFTADGKDSRIAFHGVPGGHEFNSFIIGLYNAAGPGQTIDEALKARITQLNKSIEIKILISLSCTMCPELVMAAQKLACENENIRAEMFDLSLYPDLKEKYKVMSVPCLVVNNDKVTFGRKNLEELLTWLEKI